MLEAWLCESAIVLVAGVIHSSTNRVIGFFEGSPSSASWDWASLGAVEVERKDSKTTRDVPC